jgi:4-amino-4-deoxy-L-arabinose transferase-like glycosyltransferase
MLSRWVRQFQFAGPAVVLLIIVIRVPSLVHPRAIDDEAVYSVVANEIVDGGRPYRDAVERKPPLLFWTYAAIFRVAGKYNWYALHTVALLWTLCTVAGVYMIGRELFDGKVGLIAALLYSIYQSWAHFTNLAFNGETLMNFPIVWAWAIAFGQSSSRLRPELAVAGALLCAAFLLKQPGAIAAVPLGIYPLLSSYRLRRAITRTASVIQAALLTAGFFTLLGLIVIVLQTQGILRDALYWTISAQRIQHVFWQNGILATLAFTVACLPLIIGAAPALRDSQKIWATKNSERLALLGLLAASAIGTAASARFYPHYYIQLVPPLALLAAPYLRAVFRQRILRPLPAAAIGIWLALTVVSFSIAHWCGLIPRRRPTQTGQYLATHTAADDRIFIWGRSAAQYYLDAHRRPACRYVVTFPLTGFIFGEPLPGVDTRPWITPGAWANLEEDFARHPPAYIADLYATPDAQYPVRDFVVLSTVLVKNYRPVAQINNAVIYQRRP